MAVYLNKMVNYSTGFILSDLVGSAADYYKITPFAVLLFGGLATIAAACAATFSQRHIVPVLKPSIPSVIQILQSLDLAGGVENGGNTCSLSILLQEFAALPEVYGSFITAKLRKRSYESNEHFSHREELQHYLRNSIANLTHGITTNKEQIFKITKVLIDLGWQKDSLWSILHQKAPSIFSLPLSSPHKLYELVLSLLSDEEIDYPYDISLLGRTGDHSVKALLKEKSSTNDLAQKTLFRITQDLEAQSDHEEELEISERRFSLKIILARQETTQGNHFVLYRKYANDWICCNDRYVTKVDTLPTKNIFAAVYLYQK